MRKRLVLVLGLLCASAASAADLRLLMGPAVATYSNRWPALYDDYPFDGSGLNPFKNYKAGVAFGLGIGFPIAKGVALEVDVLYAGRGADYKLWYPSIGNDGYEESHDLKGVSFPALLKIAPLPRPFPYFLAGGDVTFILSHRRRTFSLYNYEYDDQWVGGGGEDFDPSTKKWDFGAVMGVGIDVPISKGFLFVEGRYEIGMTDLYRGSEQASVKTRTFLLILGYRIGGDPK